MVALVVLPGMDGTTAPRADFAAALGPGIEPRIVSYPPDLALGYAELEARVRASLPADRPYVLLGESFSGPIAISIAASRPPQLIGLILCVTFACNPLPVLGSMPWLLPVIPFGLAPMRVINALLLGRFATQASIAAVRATFDEVPTTTFKARLGAVARGDMRPALANVDMPVLYLRATEDHLVPRRCAEAIARVAPQTRIVDIEAPHTLLQVRPAAAAAAVKAFVATLPAQR
jgi:pimeloyl-[acyl-carrier protein] methyl ester esterase